ncbi:dimethylaniline monooxygenase [N-oxide-forming] 5-like [Pomacea canaliculata]|uniref:dimethylaniline monooxygenase [N-oxide-forming] 5-like n=1 Tax=Pomacea canaliculata TaxID=400727 RepID=UPI000D73252B|nr:dimethylaniline monooxygenase [N-oxide-forming] 5-like [Pomacea canaliculata]
MVKRVAVIGGGAAGLVATKTCLEEGLEPTCFDRRDSLGGLWVFDEKVQDNLSNCMWTTTMNTSKEIIAFSDFPMPKKFPNFIRSSHAEEYLQSYALNFNLDKFTRLSTEVVMIKRAEDFFTSGRWTVTSKNLKNGETMTEVFDGVMVCSGHHLEKHIPKLPGLDEFKGQIMHSHDYRKPLTLTGKRVLVVGLGNSGGDIASEVGLSTEVMLSTRRGAWVMERRGSRGLPWDIEMLTRFGSLVDKLLPLSLSQKLLAASFMAKLDHDLYSLTTTSMPKGVSGFLSDDLANRILCGRVHIRDDIKRFAESSVEFVDGTVEDVDVVILATGYHIRFPFIEKEGVDIKDNLMPLYKRVFLPDLEHQTLSFIGFFNVSGSLWQIFELQSRMAVYTLTGAIKLPSRRKMKEDIREMEKKRTQICPDSLRHSVAVAWFPFMEELAEVIGCKPNVWRLLLTDPKLGLKVLFGPVVGAHYRLHGPGQWSGARHSILTVMDRVYYPFNTRKVPSGLPQSIELLRRLLYPSTLQILAMYLFILMLLVLVFVV